VTTRGKTYVTTSMKLKPMIKFRRMMISILIFRLMILKKEQLRKQQI
jgi:hypothetical protein